LFILLAKSTYMQFGKSEDNTFALDFKYPFSPLQAFAIAISAMDTRIGCCYSNYATNAHYR